ncbi:MAG: hypothetical protein NC084_06350 [Bacteroides sp.]|nr:hypothetical protein [Eubacterium sp.]MCM1418155.1 hypothetical protein [Roseburia sp.]MCM1462320.1 hypothetical protein [Bacteroides sp.]
MNENYVVSNVLHYLSEGRPELSSQYERTPSNNSLFEQPKVRFASQYDPITYAKQCVNAGEWTQDPIFTAIQSLADKQCHLDLAIGKKHAEDTDEVVVAFDLVAATYPQWMFVASVIPSLLPDIFKNKTPLTAEELKVLEALGKGNDTPFVSTTRDRHHREWQELLKKNLKDRLQADILRRLDTGKILLKNAEDEYENAVQELYGYGNRLAKRKQEVDALRKQYETSSASLDMTELIKFADSMGVQLELQGDYLHITCATLATNYEEDVAETYITAPNSELFSDSDEPQGDFLRKLYQTVFLDKKYFLRIKQGFNIKDNNQPTRDGKGMTVYLADHAIANPHITKYDCFGTGRTARLSEKLTNSDWKGYIAELVAVTGGLTFSDVTVMQELNREILQNKDQKIFEDKEGVLWSANEIVQSES